MKSPTPNPSVSAGEDTGLPGFRTWRSVYLFVLGCFALWTGLLTALSLMFE